MLVPVFLAMLCLAVGAGGYLTNWSLKVLHFHRVMKLYQWDKNARLVNAVTINSNCSQQRSFEEKVKSTDAGPSGEQSELADIQRALSEVSAKRCEEAWELALQAGFATKNGKGGYRFESQFH